MNQTAIDVFYVPPQGVPNWLPTILPHIEECHRDAPQEYSENEEADLLLSGRVSLWVATRDGALVGHASTSLYQAGGVNYVHLPHMWTKAGVGRVLEAFVEGILPYVRSVGAKGVTYRTGRNAAAFARRLKNVGMKPRLVEFFMSVD